MRFKNLFWWGGSVVIGGGVSALVLGAMVLPLQGWWATQAGRLPAYALLLLAQIVLMVSAVGGGLAAAWDHATNMRHLGLPGKHAAYASGVALMVCVLSVGSVWAAGGRVRLLWLLVVVPVITARMLAKRIWRDSPGIVGSGSP